MLIKLKAGGKLVGIKQCQKAIRENRAEIAFLAEDADAKIRGLLVEVCEETGTEMISVPTMKELGETCGIEVGSAVAVLLKERV